MDCHMVMVEEPNRDQMMVEEPLDGRTTQRHLTLVLYAGEYEK